MIGDLRELGARVERLEAALQRPTQEIRDSGDLRLRWGRQPDGAYTVRAHDPAGNVIADLLGLGPVVTSLPGSPTPGQVVRYKPYGAAAVTTWLLVWDPAVNGGAGGWSWIGGSDHWALQGAATAQTTANIATTTALNNSPSISLPAGGIYSVHAAGDMQATTSGLTQGVIYAALGGTSVAAVASMTAQDGAFDESTGGATVHLTVPSSTTLSLRIGTNNKSLNAGAYVPWRILVHPVELRP